MSNNLTVVLPNQLFEKPFFLKDKKIKIIIYEHPKFFTKYKFHKLKLIYHRATMKKYFSYLKEKKLNVEYVEFDKKLDNIISKKYNILKIHDPVDIPILNEYKKICKSKNLDLEIEDSKLFLLSNEEIKEYGDNNKKYINRDFYRWIRTKKNILMKDNEPIGGKWSFDSDNRNPFEKNYKEDIKFKNFNNKFVKEARDYILKNFEKNPGETDLYLPIDFSGSKKRFRKFLKEKLKNFGKYQDAVKDDVYFGYHSILSPMINIGLLDPNYIVTESEKFYKNNKSIPISSIEGYLRQILSWREYVRMLYILENNNLSKTNFFKHKRKVNKHWFDGTTQIKPIDDIIKKVLKTGYAHHIERLMFLGNFMLLCEFDPKDVFDWFISIVSIDAYEWVMVPNIYGMSQFSAGDLMMTRPYFSSSNYILKMSNYTKKSGEKVLLGKEEYLWSEIWDALYYNFINNNSKYLAKNYSTANAVTNWNKKSKKDKENLLKISKLYKKNY